MSRFAVVLGAIAGASMLYAAAAEFMKMRSPAMPRKPHSSNGNGPSEDGPPKQVTSGKDQDNTKHRPGQTRPEDRQSRSSDSCVALMARAELQLQALHMRRILQLVVR